MGLEVVLMAGEGGEERCWGGGSCGHGRDVIENQILFGP